MAIVTILQNVNLPDVWAKLADNGLSFVFLAIAVVILWKRDSAMSERMEKYLGEDRKQMIDVISHNTAAFEDLKDTLKEIMSEKK